jgi:phosphoadenosine phosphosulfate reductase
MTQWALTAPQADYERLDRATPREIMAWAAASVERLALATSFQSSGLVLLHMLRDIRADVPILFLDTGFHFPETIAFRDRIVEMWDLRLVVLAGEHGSPERQAQLHGRELYRRDPELCCRINKVEPLQRSLEEHDAWVSGIRRDQSPLRARTPVLEAQLLPSGNEVLKIHPLANWTFEDVDDYIRRYEIPTHPLLERGFGAIGCWPCTRALRAGESERDGRWDGFAKTECGIHTFGRPNTIRKMEAEQ